MYRIQPKLRGIIGDTSGQFGKEILSFLRYMSTLV